jgi:hypothetical protein
MRLPIVQKRPSFLMSTCTSSPGRERSYRCTGSRAGTSKRETPWRRSTFQTVEAGRPS